MDSQARVGALEAVGVGLVEGQVYDLLLTRGRLSLAEVAKETDLDPGQVSTLVGSLVAHGLVRTLPGRDQVFVVAPPEPAIEALVANRMNELQRLRAQAAELAAWARRSTSQVEPAELIEIVTGEGANRHLFLQSIQSARENMAVFDCPPYGVDPTESDPLQAARMQSGLRLRTVFDRSLLDDPPHVARILRGVEAGEQGRLADVPLKLAIIDRETAFLPLLHEGHDTPEAVMIVRPSVLLDSLVALFESVWRNAVEVSPRTVEKDPTEHGRDDDDLRELARLLATGMTDTAIAGHLGVSERTVRRRVQDLLRELRADSRFLAGVRAVQRGWL